MKPNSSVILILYLEVHVQYMVIRKKEAPPRPHGGRATEKPVDCAENVGGLQNTNYRRDQKQHEERICS